MRSDVPAIKRTTFKARCPAGKSKIALVVHPGEDYHFYREDPDGYWSHKDGSNEVKRFDAEGKPIVNPETAARDYRPRGSFLNYKDFCGFYCVPRNEQVHLARGGRRLHDGGGRRLHDGGGRRTKSALHGRKTVRRIQHRQRTRRTPTRSRVKLSHTA